MSSHRTQSKVSTRSIALSALPAQSLILEQSSPARSIILAQTPAPSLFLAAQSPSSEARLVYEESEDELRSQQPAQSIALSAYTLQQAASPALLVASPAPSLAAAQSLVAQSPAILRQWADYSPEEVELPFPELPEPDYKCYAPPQVPPGQTRYLKVDEPAVVKNLEQNFNDVRTAIRVNNTHVQRNKTQITNVNRNHNHLLRIVTNENNFEHNLTNKIVRVADTHRQKIESVPGETRNFKDYKQTQRVEAQGCRRADTTTIVNAPSQAGSASSATNSASIRSAPATTLRTVSSIPAASIPAASVIRAPSNRSSARNGCQQ